MNDLMRQLRNRTIPGEGLTGELAGEQAGRVAGEDFARRFFTFYLGEHPPDVNLKAGLLGGGKS